MMHYIKAIFLVSVLSVCACTNPFSTYKMDIRQGNYVTQDMVDKLRPNMSKSSVQEVMGTASMKHVLAPNQWDYFYSFKSGDGSEKVEKKFSIFFQNEKLAHVEGDWEPKSFS